MEKLLQGLMQLSSADSEHMKDAAISIGLNKRDPESTLENVISMAKDGQKINVVQAALND